MGFLKKIKQLISNKKEEDKSSEVIQYNENPSNLEVIPDGEYVYFDDEDEFGEPRAFATQVAVRKIAEDILNDIMTTW